MKKIVTWLLHEIKQVWMASAFFFIGFSIIGLLKYLFLAEYHIHTVKFSKAFVFALVVGKVVVVLDKTPFGNRFRQHAVALDVFYRSLIYSSITFVVLALEIQSGGHDLRHRPSHPLWLASSFDRRGHGVHARAQPHARPLGPWDP